MHLFTSSNIAVWPYTVSGMFQKYGEYNGISVSDMPETH